MNNSLDYFLIVAEELSITKSAKRLFVSPQCVSKHIQRLEENYNAQFFIRKPKFALTLEGEALLKSIRKMQLVENSLFDELSDIRDGSKGVLRIGIHTTRARVIV